eukprot:TRINITY_DN20729_c0_g1_i1.p1 TRINITY_DN20729_c0_g1~~TRINITY_DN20729_c0_g1_i1.p1  ORF type:complete len:564 (+),score=112.87 TRINITY_DN20729_c0_g1_i1:77-1768(+)
MQNVNNITASNETQQASVDKKVVDKIEQKSPNDLSERTDSKRLKIEPEGSSEAKEKVSNQFEDIEVPRSMVFLNHYKASKAGSLVKCGFDGCDINDENDDWQVIDKEFEVVRKLELHVSSSMDRFMSKNKHLLCDEMQFPELESVRNSFVQIVVELQSQNSQSGVFLQPAIRTASPRWVNQRVRIMTIQFFSRCSLMRKLRMLAPLKDAGNRIWITLVSHSTSQGQVFSCTPKELIQKHNGGDKDMEEFCSVHDFVTVAQNTFQETLLGVHISACSGLYFHHSRHEVWPNYSSWLTKRMKVCLTGYRRDLHTTDGALLLLFSTLMLAASNPITSKQVADEMNKIPNQLPGLALGTGFLPPLLPGEEPLSGKGPLPKKRKGEQPATETFDIFVLFAGRSCWRLKSTVAEVILPAIKLRNDMLKGSLEIEDKELEWEELFKKMSQVLFAAEKRVIFVVVTSEPQGTTKLEECYQRFEINPSFGGLISIGSSRSSVNWVVTHDCCKDCCSLDPEHEEGCPDRVNCFHRFTNLMCGLFWGLILIAGEGWSIPDIQKEMVYEAPGIVL